MRGPSGRARRGDGRPWGLRPSSARRVDRRARPVRARPRSSGESSAWRAPAPGVRPSGRASGRASRRPPGLESFPSPGVAAATVAVDPVPASFRGARPDAAAVAGVSAGRVPLDRPGRRRTSVRSDRSGAADGALDRSGTVAIRPAAIEIGGGLQAEFSVRSSSALSVGAGVGGADGTSGGDASDSGRVAGPGGLDASKGRARNRGGHRERRNGRQRAASSASLESPAGGRSTRSVGSASAGAVAASSRRGRRGSRPGPFTRCESTWRPSRLHHRGHPDPTDVRLVRFLRSPAADDLPHGRDRAPVDHQPQVPPPATGPGISAGYAANPSTTRRAAKHRARPRPSPPRRSGRPATGAGTSRDPVRSSAGPLRPLSVAFKCHRGSALRRDGAIEDWRRTGQVS